MKRALDLLFPQDLIKQPVIYEMAKKFDVIFNIRRAKVNEKIGEMVLELEGEPAVLARAVDWLKSRGLKVEPMTHDTVES
jgi:ABC-type methionine transport system ATPase subunit